MTTVSSVPPPPAVRLGWVAHRTSDRGGFHSPRTSDERPRSPLGGRVENPRSGASHPRASAVDGIRPSTTPVFFDSIDQHRASALSYAELEQRQWQPFRSLPQDSAYITARPERMSEYDAARIFLERPEDPVSAHGLRLAEALAREYNISTDEVRSIWANKAYRSGKTAGYMLSQWQTDAFPPFFPDPAYPERDVPRERRSSRPPHREVTSDWELWGPRSTTKYMLLGDAPARLVGAELSEGPAPAFGPEMPGHKRHQRWDANVKTISCDRGERPPEGHIDIMIVECLNLKVPHKFQSFWNVNSISPFVQVEVVERGANGAEMIQYLKTTTMSRNKMEIFKRSPIDSVYNETCRFYVPHLHPSDVAAASRTNILVSVIDADSSKCLGSVTIPAGEVLRKRAAPFYTWYELMKPAPDGHLVPVEGSEPDKLSCIQLGFWSHPLSEGEMRFLRDDAREHALAHENLFLADQEAALDHEEERLRAIRAAQDRRMRDLEGERSRLAQNEEEMARQGPPSSGPGRMMPELPSFSLPDMPELSMPSFPAFSLPIFSESGAKGEEGKSVAEVTTQEEAVAPPQESRPAAPQVVPVVPVSTVETPVSLEDKGATAPEVADDAASDLLQALDAMRETGANKNDDEEALRPWMAVKDVRDLIATQKIQDGGRRRWVLDLVPGVLGLLHGIAAAGYEIRLTCKAAAPQAAAVLKVLRNLGVVGGIIKEEHVMFARTYADKVALVQAVGGFTHLVDDDWYILKRSAALSNGVHLILFNPDSEAEEEYLRDEAAWILYRKSLVPLMQQMGATQAAIVHGRGSTRPASPAQLEEWAVQLRKLEEEGIRKFLHLYDMEPSHVTCVQLDTLAETKQARMYPAASAVRSWLNVAKSLRVDEANRFLATLDASDVATPRSKAAGELLAYALHRGRVEGQEAPARAMPAGSVAEADVFVDKTDGDAVSEVRPFFPLDEAPGASQAANARYEAWRAGLNRAFDHMGFGLDFFAPPHDTSQPSDGTGRRPLEALEVMRVLPSGPAARSGAIEPGMLLISVDGLRLDVAGAPDGREALGTRVALYRDSADGKNSARQQSFRTLAWSQVSDMFEGARARELADAGLFLDGDGCVKCQCCRMPVRGMAKGETLAGMLHRDLPGSCPLTDVDHLRSVEERQGAARIEPRAADMRPEHLSCGIVLGFLPAPQDSSAKVTVTDFGLDQADLERVVYVWLRPEPVAPLLPPGNRGRVLIDIDRVVLRLRYFDIESDGSVDKYRDSWSGMLLPAPTSAYTWRDLEEVLDSQGRLIFVDHLSKTTALEPPALLNPRPLPPGWESKIDEDGRMFYHHSVCFPGPQPNLERAAVSSACVVCIELVAFECCKRTHARGILNNFQLCRSKISHSGGSHLSDGNAMDGHALSPRLLLLLMRDRCIHGAAARAHAYAPRLWIL